ncbi:MAG: hypothetical protein PHW24_04030 [Candidatus Moranbacteria bacterium]|nr:hypothetical protein [Candidatus Moranbacteria bacterium]
MAKSQKRIEARKLRQDGLSLNEIVKKLQVSKSSVSLWCGDIKLTEKQKTRLDEKIIKGSYTGRLIGAKMQKDRKERKIEECLVEAKREINSLKKRDLMIAGVSLYWGEGSKTNSDVRFCNSNAVLIRFAMRWLRESFNVEEYRFMMYLSVNEIHKDRLNDIIKYWSEITNVPVNQFRKPTLLKIRNKKIYTDFSNHYGTLTIRISKSKYLLYKILGLIEALGEAG